MDACCYNRIMDDQEQDRIYIESEVIKIILINCENGEWTLIGGDVLEYELNRNTNIEKKQKAFILYGGVNEKHSLTDEIKTRAKEFEKFGIKSMDSLHLSTAESSNADILLSTDDRFIKASARTNSKIKVMNPVDWYMEVLKSE